MARRFTNPSAEKVTFGVGGASGLTGGNVTLAAIVKINNDTTVNGNNNGALLRCKTSANALIFGLRFDAVGGTRKTLNYGIGGAGNFPPTLDYQASDGWVLAAVSKASGTAIPTFYRYRYSDGTFTSESLASGVGDASGTASYYVTGEDTGVAAADRYLDADVEAIGVFGSVLTSAQIARLAFSLRAWHDLSPLALWLYDQPSTSQAIRDVTGRGATQTAITGTSIPTQWGPIFGYGHPVVEVTRNAGSSLTASASWSSSSSLSGASTQGFAGTATWSSASSLTATATQTQPVSASWSSASAMNAPGAVIEPAAGTWSSASALTATAGLTQAASATWSAASSLSGAASQTYADTATWSSSSTLTASLGVTGSASWSSASALTAAVTLTQQATATWSSASGLTATAVRTLTASATWSSTSSLTATGALLAAATLAWLAASSLSASASVARSGAAAWSSASGMVATATVVGPVTVVTPGRRVRPGSSRPRVRAYAVPPA